MFDGITQKCTLHSIDACCGQLDKLKEDESFLSGFHCPSCWSTRGQCPCEFNELLGDSDGAFLSDGSIPEEISPTVRIPLL